MQENLWQFVEPQEINTQTSSSSSNSNNGAAAVTTDLDPIFLGATVSDGTTTQASELARELELQYRVGRIIVSMVRDSIFFSIIHFIDP